MTVDPRQGAWGGPVRFPNTSPPSPFFDPHFALERYVSVVGSLLPADWEQSPRWRNHPVGRRVLACRALLNSGVRLRIPEDEGLLPTLGLAMLDSLAFVHASGGDATRIEVGSSPGFGDAAKAIVLERHAQDPGQFEDMLVEMVVGAWHRDQGHVVRGIEEGRKADLLVVTPAGAEMLVECKRLRSITEGRLEKELREVNARLRGSTAATVGVLHVASPLSRTLSPETLPLPVERARRVTMSWFERGRLKDTDCIVLTWDDYVIRAGIEPEAHVVTVRRMARGILSSNGRAGRVVPYGGHLVHMPVRYLGP